MLSWSFVSNISVTLFYSSFLCFSGHSLTCISCTSNSQTPCTGSAVTCASTEDVCTSIYTETKLSMYKLTTYAIVRGCGYSSECNIPKSLSNQFMSVDINIGCCKADNCTPTTPIVTPTNVNKNSLVCPSCFVLSSASCVADNTVDCTGTENRCTTYSISTATDPPGPFLAMAGCATENMCSNYTGNASTSSTGEMKISIGCSNATVSPQATSSSPVSPSSAVASVSISHPISTTTGLRATSYHYTTGIANSYPTNQSTEVYYSTRVTYTPTAFHSTTRDHVTLTSTCQCNGCANPHFGLALIVSCIFSLVKCLL
ncbi:uncharacterized protein LOC142187923 [Leptodactylus fuscus]|uniref:uncharacterized protein LOC142187923 n=1 Tax=Leptodactylus fuscus TaxID=238119 RepID=UPI003F4EA478